MSSGQESSGEENKSTEEESTKPIEPTIDLNDGNPDDQIDDLEDLPIKEDDGEQMRLGGHKPIYTILLQSIGPLLQQVVAATYGIVDTFFVSKALGKTGLSSIGAAATLEGVNNGFAQIFSTCVSSKLGFLYGQKRNEECAQVVCDMFRFAVVYALICMAIILSTAKPLIKWMGASDEVIEGSFEYMLPLSCGSIILDFYMILCGILQSEGRSYLYGIVQVCSLCINMILFDPLFLLKLKTGIWGASLASIIASFIPLVGLSFPLWMGKFTVKPKFSMLFNKFSKETYGALKIGLSSLVGLLSGCLPMILFQMYMGSWSSKQGIFDEVNSSVTVLLRIINLIYAVDTALAQGLLPSASFAYGAQRINRLMWLGIHDMWIGTAWNALCDVIIVALAREIAKILLDDEAFLNYAEKFLKLGTYTIVLVHIQYVCSVLLQATKQVKYASIQSVVTLLLPIPVFSTIIYFVDKSQDPTHLLYSFIANDTFSFIFCSVFIWWRLGFIFKEEPSEAIIENVSDEKVLSVDAVDEL